MAGGLKFGEPRRLLRKKLPWRRIQQAGFPALACRAVIHRPLRDEHFRRIPSGHNLSRRPFPQDHVTS